MAEFNLNLKEFDNALASNHEVQREIRKVAVVTVEEAKNALINDFENHPVSQEISSGPNASNISGTLDGYGNLFSFIGFDVGSAPIDNFKKFLSNKIRLSNRAPRISSSGGGFSLDFEIDGPTNEEIKENSRMPWESGRSWVLGIERGISGFSSFISKRLGRSGGGIQSKGAARSGSYRRTSYWSKLWSQFAQNIR